MYLDLFGCSKLLLPQIAPNFYLPRTLFQYVGIIPSLALREYIMIICKQEYSDHKNNGQLMKGSFLIESHKCIILGDIFLY